MTKSLHSKTCDKLYMHFLLNFVRILVVYAFFVVLSLNNTVAANEYSWVLKDLKVTNVEIGQKKSDVKKLIPNLYFSDQNNNAGDGQYDIGVILDVDNLKEDSDSEDIEFWSIAFFFSKDEEVLFLIRATYPPEKIAQNTDQINKILEKLGSPLIKESFGSVKI